MADCKLMGKRYHFDSKESEGGGGRGGGGWHFEDAD